MTKPTRWQTIPLSECEILEKYEYTIKVKHPAFPRARYFIKSFSKKGGWYWRNTGKESDIVATAIFIDINK